MPGRASLRVRRLVIATVAAIATTVGLAGTAWAQTPTGSPSPAAGADVDRAEDQVVLAGTVAVPRGRAVGEVVVFSGRVAVAGVVAGDVVVLDGPIAISGQVSGSVIAMNGPIRLAGTASVGGDVLGAETVRMQPGAVVGGSVRDDVAFTPRGALAALGALLGAVAIAVSVLLLVLLLLALVPRGLDRVAGALRTAPFASIGWGLAIAIVLPVLTVASAASILGLPLGLAAFLAFGLLGLLGLACAAFGVGRLVVAEPRGRVGAAAAGWGIVAALGLVPFLNVAVWTAGAVVGLGASLVAIWRVRAGPSGKGRHRAGSATRRPAEEAPILLPPDARDDASADTRPDLPFPAPDAAPIPPEPAEPALAGDPVDAAPTKEES
jgi:hypothetical protein